MKRTNKDILLGYIATLPDDVCREMYYLIREEQDPGDKLTFDKVKLTRGEYNKLIWWWGKEKTDICIQILNDWINKNNITKPLSYYHNIVSWVERAYYRSHPANDKSLRFNRGIDSPIKARKYILSIPKELRAYDSEVKFLIEKFGSKILY